MFLLYASWVTSSTVTEGMRRLLIGTALSRAADQIKFKYLKGGVLGGSAR